MLGRGGGVVAWRGGALVRCAVMVWQSWAGLARRRRRGGQISRSVG